MKERNEKQHERYRRIRKRKINRTIILILSFFIIIIIIAILGSILLKGSEEHVILNYRDIQPGLTLEDDTECNLTLVNKWNSIPENYEINLVEVPGGEKVDERIYEPLMDMLEAAKEGNWNQLPKVVSGYRTQEKQQQIYDEKIAKYKQEGYSNEEAVEQAQQWVAVPGHSEHQLGIAVDINGATYDLYFWLQENSYKYGFIFRYPGDKTDITGTAEEVWHYRYVGVEAATEMYEQGLSLEEYLDRVEKERVD
ncbi:MAG: M15 family metallopeptidase [Candidatus Ruminococcus intestinipullorum]|nr:M15 family metallopeptidase [Candidatus Ruminococcus intestinipullorum]